jgi:hypothetical protein
MKTLIKFFYSMAAGLEQASLTFNTIDQAYKRSAAMPKPTQPKIKPPMGFTR